jgi:hypothetical protein
VIRECPSKRTYIATDDGGYISTSDAEDDTEDDPPSNKGLSLSAGDAGTQQICIVHRVLGTQLGQADKMQRHNLFQILFVITIGVHVSSLMEAAATTWLVLIWSRSWV